MNLFTILDDIEHVGDNFCETSNVLSVLRMCGYLLTILKLFVPIIIIIWGTLKFYNAVTKGSSDSFNKQLKSLLYRVGIGIMVFFIPTIIDAILVNFIPEESKKCEACILKPFSCDPSNPSSIDTSKPEPTTQWVDPKCTNRNSSQRYCENKSGCTWNRSTNKCEYASNTDACANSCSSYAQGTAAYFHCIDNCTNTSETTGGTTDSETKGKCDSRNESENMCLSAPGNKCYWDDTLESGNKCQYRSESDKCDEKCSPTHLKGTEQYNTCYNACLTDKAYCSKYADVVSCQNDTTGRCGWFSSCLPKSEADSKMSSSTLNPGESTIITPTPSSKTPQVSVSTPW